tara:strand:- start:613 stop:1254 length:642 start_codon:yes stop_codon:yes gene_type:complete
MLVVEYEKIKKYVPTDWKDITIREFHNLYQVIYKYEDDDLDNDEVKKLMFLKEYASFLLKEERSYIERMEVEDIEHLVQATNKLMTQYEPQNLENFTYEDVKYYFPRDISKQTFGEYIECQALEKSAKVMKNGKFDVIAEQMARLCKTDDELGTYLDEEVVQERAEKFKDLTMDIVWEFNFFLLNFQKNLAKGFRIYGEEKLGLLKPLEQVNY